MKTLLLKQDLHCRDSFCCGVEELDTYLKRYALQDVKRNLTKVFVLTEQIPEEIIGYYTLSPISFSKDELSLEMSKKLPRYPIPAILLGRLAVSSPYQKQGIGARLLMDALSRVYQASESNFGIYAVIVDAKDDRACAFYKHFGLIPFPDKPYRLFISLEKLKPLFSAA